MYAVAPTSTIDLAIESGNEIEIEERSASEVTLIQGKQIAPIGVDVYNPAFDITPARYITAIITEEVDHAVAGGRDTDDSHRMGCPRSSIPILHRSRRGDAGALTAQVRG